MKCFENAHNLAARRVLQYVYICDTYVHEVQLFGWNGAFHRECKVSKEINWMINISFITKIPNIHVCHAWIYNRLSVHFNKIHTNWNHPIYKPERRSNMATIHLRNIQPILLIHRPTFMVNWTAVVWRAYRHTDCCFMFLVTIHLYFIELLYIISHPGGFTMCCQGQSGLWRGCQTAPWCMTAHTPVSSQHAAALWDAGLWAHGYTCRHQGGIPLPCQEISCQQG